MNKKIFNNEINDFSTSRIKEEIEDKGYFFTETFLSKEFLSSIEDDIKNYRFSTNQNQPTGTYTFGQYYFVDLLAISKNFYDYLTSSFVIEICKKYFGEKFRLKSLRYYETYGKFHMQWHTDNKTDREFAEIPGLIFIFYIADVNDGEFQYVEGSHTWSNLTAYNDFSDEYIDENFADKVRSFKGKAGSLIIYNSYGVHRAKPSDNSLMIRKSVFFQIDSDIGNSEPIFINTSFHTNKSKFVEQLLGFGLPQSYENFPKSDVGKLPLPIKFSLVFQMLKGSLQSLVYRHKNLLRILKVAKRFFQH